MTSQASTPAGDPAIPGPATCPQEYYRGLRASGPVLDLGGRITVLGRREVDSALRTPHTFSSSMDAVDLGNTRPLIPLQIDPPDHAKYRRLLDPLFSPKNIARLAPVITQRVTELIDAVIAQGHCDFSADLAVPLPVLIFGDMLGLRRSDHQALMSIVNGIMRPSAQDHGRRSAVQAGERCYALFSRALDERAQAPRDDLLTRLLRATVDGHRPSREELLDMCYMLVLGGMDTTSDALECAFAFLATHPEHRRQIAGEPGIVPTAVEELLRWESPTTSVRRYLLDDTELGGCPMKAGQRVNVVLASANTDGNHVPDAFEVDLRRTPNHHMAFGAGVHRCPGAHLARMELRIVLREWHRRIPDYTLTANAHLDYRLAGSLRYLERLPLSWPAPPPAEGAAPMTDRMRRILTACWADRLGTGSYPSTQPSPEQVAKLVKVSESVAAQWGDLLPRIIPDAAPEAVATFIDKISRGRMALLPRSPWRSTIWNGLSALSSSIGLIYVADWLMDADDKDMGRALEAFVGDAQVQAAIQATAQGGHSPIPQAVYARCATTTAPGDPSPTLTAPERHRLLALTTMRDGITKSVRPEDQPWLLGYPLLGILLLARETSELSLKYLDADDKEAFWRQHARALAEVSIHSAAILAFAATAYALYRNEDPALPPLSAIYHLPALRDDFGPLVNVVVRVYDDYNDRAIDRERATFALNIFNDPHPAFVNEFLRQAGITEEDTALKITTALQSGSEEDALAVLEFFKDLKCARFKSISEHAPPEYSQYMTLLARMLENTYASRFAM